MESSENITDVTKKEYQDAELDQMISQLTRVLEDPSRSHVLGHIKQVAKQDKELYSSLKALYAKASKGDLPDDELYRFINKCEGKIQENMDENHKYDVLMATLLMFIVMFSTTGLWKGTGAPGDIISEPLKNFLTAWLYALLTGGAMHLFYLRGWNNNFMTKSFTGYMADKSFTKLEAEAKENLKPTGIPLDELVDYMNELSEEEAADSLGKVKFNELRNEF